MPERRTAEIKPRDGKDTDKVQVNAILGLFNKAKQNPWVLVALALGGGTGTQELLAQLGQNVQWWWIAVAVVGFGALNYMTDSAKRQERIREALSEINAQLREGKQVMDHLKEDVGSLKDWRRAMVERMTAAQAVPEKHKRRGSEGSLRPAPDGA